MRNDLKVIILVGPPGSGKSTWCKNFLSKHSDYCRINRDDFRFMLKNSPVCEPHIEKLINDLQDTAIIKSLVANQNVIIDNTNLKAKYINDIIKLVKEYADVEFIVFDVSLQKCLEQNKLRDKVVGEDILKKMYKDYLVLKDSFVFQNIKRERTTFKTKTNYTTGLPEAVIFDVDGTLAFLNNRNEYDSDKVDRDIFNDIVGEHINFHISKGRKIIILSGRDDDAKILTKEWLDFYGVKYDYFFLREKNDIRKDKIFKKEVYDTYIKDKYNVLCVYDDRLSVLNMWYKMGLFTFNVNQGNKEF